MLDLAGWQVNLIKRIVERERERETERERDTERERARERERERLSVGVPLPSVQPPTLTSQAERHKTSRSQLSSSLDSSLAHAPTHIHRLPSDTCSDARSALSRGARTLLVPPLQREGPAGLSLLRTEPCPVSCEWCLPLCETADGSAHRRKERFHCPPPQPQKKNSPVPNKQQMWQKRRGGERNTISPTPPSLIWENNTQTPVGEGSAFVPLPTLPLQEPRADRRADTLTRCCETRSRRNNTCCAVFFMCVFWFSTWTAPEQQRCRPHVRSSLAPRRPWDRRAAPAASTSWKRSSSLRSFGRGLSRLWPPRDRRASSWPASPPAGGWPSEFLTFLSQSFVPPTHSCEMCSIDCLSVIWCRNHWTRLVRHETGRVLVFWTC